MNIIKVICEGVECIHNSAKLGELNGECTLKEVYIGDEGESMFCDSAEFPPYKD